MGRHPWIELEESLAVASDLERTIARLQALPELAVVDLSLAGELHLLGRQQLEAALSVAEARFRSLRTDLSRLRLQPTEDDLAALHAAGSVARVIAELSEEKEEGNAELAREAMAILAALLLETQGQGETA